MHVARVLFFLARVAGAPQRARIVEASIFRASHRCGSPQRAACSDRHTRPGGDVEVRSVDARARCAQGPTGAMVTTRPSGHPDQRPVQRLLHARQVALFLFFILPSIWPQNAAPAYNHTLEHVCNVSLVSPLMLGPGAIRWGQEAMLRVVQPLRILPIRLVLCGAQVAPKRLPNEDSRGQPKLASKPTPERHAEQRASLGYIS